MFSSLLLVDDNRIEVTNLFADTAANAEIRVNHVSVFPLSMDCGNRAVPRADGAAGAFIRKNFKGNKTAANLGWAAFIVDMRFIFAQELVHRGDNRVWRALTQTAKAILDDLAA